MPEVLTVWRWRHEREEFCKLIQRAREAQSEAMLDECQSLSDAAAQVALDPECGSASVAAKKLAIETRLKVAARFAPEKFGDRVRQDVAGVPGAPLERQDHPGPPAAGPAPGRRENRAGNHRRQTQSVVHQAISPRQLLPSPHPPPGSLSLAGGGHQGAIPRQDCPGREKRGSSGSQRIG